MENINPEIFRKKNAELTAQILTAQAEISTAKAAFKSHGDRADEKWFQERMQFVRDKTTELHTLNRDFKAVQNKEKDANMAGLRFMSVAKSHLSPEVFKSISELAKNHATN